MPHHRIRHGIPEIEKGLFQAAFGIGAIIDEIHHRDVFFRKPVHIGGVAEVAAAVPVGIFIWRAFEEIAKNTQSVGAIRIFHGVGEGQHLCHTGC